ncbi:MAG: Arc family DNA-binding protein [Betaproteobacteria bacterium]|nr:Arc family DNA-binding protein [Betaproteobacteria bacterium]
MTSITIDALAGKVLERLQKRAAGNHRSVEEEIKVILESAVAQLPARRGGLADSIRDRFADLGGVELELPPSQPPREPPSFK